MAYKDNPMVSFDTIYTEYKNLLLGRMVLGDNIAGTENSLMELAELKAYKQRHYGPRDYIDDSQGTLKKILVARGVATRIRQQLNASTT
jgi:hypothetical protein